MRFFVKQNMHIIEQGCHCLPWWIISSLSRRQTGRDGWTGRPPFLCRVQYHPEFKSPPIIPTLYLWDLWELPRSMH